VNKQLKQRNGQIVGRGIEWTDYTWNPLGGCLHACQWTMPDGSVAQCYAKDVAEGVAQAFYPQGFEAHYYHPDRLDEPARVKQPRRIFPDSMADLFGRWVPASEILRIFQVMRAAHWHTFQSLTKNPLRLRTFPDMPPNLQPGASSPPDHMWGHALKRSAQETMLHKTLVELEHVAQDHHRTTWMSIEPLSWNIAPILSQHPKALAWAVVGAATNGPKVYQPDPGIVREVLAVLDEQRVPVFFKGNLRGNEAAAPWREFFPGYQPSAWNEAEPPQHLEPIGLGHIV
jgi:protein gp37